MTPAESTTNATLPLLVSAAMALTKSTNYSHYVVRDVEGHIHLVTMTEQVECFPDAEYVWLPTGGSIRLGCNR